MSINEISLTVNVSLTPEQLATAFCGMGDEDQAQFFIEVAQIVKGWGPAAGIMQWHYVGRHLRDCECSSREARNVVLEIAAAMEAGA